MPGDATNRTLLLTGATGFLGRRLAPDLASYGNVAAPGRAEMDLAEPDSIRRAFDRIRPSAVIHSGAIASPDACEADAALARRVNVDATRALAESCARSGARLIFISTDLVFDGEKGRYDEDDAPNPLSVYGRTKLDAEEAALSRAPGAVAVRVAAVYGRPLGGRACFVDELLQALPAGRAVAAFTDQWRTPTAGDRLGEVLRGLLADPDLGGVFHWGGAERATRFETATALCRALGFDEGLVRPARMGDKRTAAPRPRDSSLDSSRLAAALGLAPVKMAEGFAALKAAAGGGTHGT
jgi:dTDP-4-dehydrorhamnose reductase